ncbi:MAG: hypothetical protein KJ871_10490 [Alphaproteobacteria bacterium]|uniref:hypothetical protein n=1 Tax=Hyphomonas sp. TaxID=87 RepID=UPI001DEA13D4|nr:hypothetical protein [Alphaproteobacteria bacterium]MBU2083927.1 hypothetical protein [Alphaproteobacteria bacterium]MBU2142920.1 hypothetical protein [Alphaproteobacteria bacterium]MBU2197218.1 hypothetical protein [Alphaproteobacteria bacterium]
MTDSKKPYEGEFIPAAHLTPEAVAARKKRNIWLGLALLGFVVLVAATTMIRLSKADLSEGAGFYYSNSGGTARDDERMPIDDQPALPPGMTQEQAAPPPGIAPEGAPE